jgi:hypothetical protein
MPVGSSAGSMCRCIERSRYEEGATILTSNRGFAKCGKASAIGPSRSRSWTVYCTTLS